jgi:photosynthetic reaction center cytochrome c subunit
MNTFLYTSAAILVTGALVAWMGWERPPIDSEQRGFRGLGMVHLENPRVARREAPLHAVPEEPWPLTLPAEGEPLAGEIYENVQVLGHLGDDQFNRLMAAITEWVSPEQGCAYCHNEENLADDSVYTKVVSRRMIEMTQHINANWQDHVGDTGVTCYTCHRGLNVPQEIWFEDRGPMQAGGMAASRRGQNLANPVPGYASLPRDPLSRFFEGDDEIRVITTTALPSGNERDIFDTEWTYALMMHMSDSLGVNCTYCHNSRSFAAWDSSPPTRANAWFGIRMVRELNNEYLVPLGPVYPENRLGPHGDAPKTNCATCHLGAAKPLMGVSMVEAYPELRAPGEAAMTPAPAEAAPTEAVPATTN